MLRLLVLLPMLACILEPVAAGPARAQERVVNVYN